MPRIGYADSPSFRRLWADGFNGGDSLLIAANHVHEAKVPVRRAFSGRWRHGREAGGAQDAYQMAARRVGTSLLEDAQHAGCARSSVCSCW